MKRTSIALNDISKIFKRCFSIFNNRNWTALIVLFLVAFGFYLRIYDLGYQSLWIDESYSITAALGMIEHLIPYMPSGVVYSRGILNTGLIALSMRLFGVSEFSARLPSVLFGTMTILLVYVFFRKVFGEKIALASAFLVTFSVVEIAWSRQARMYQQLQFFYILSLYLFYRYVHSKEIKFLALAVASVFCAMFTHVLGVSLLLVIPLYYFLVNIEMVKNFNKFSKEIIVSGVIFLAGLLFSQFFFNALTHVMAVRVDYSETYIAYLITFFPVIFYLSVLGVLISLRQDWKNSLLLGLGFFIPLYFVFFHEKLVGFRYVFVMLPIMFVFFAKMAEYVAGIIAKNKIFQSLAIIAMIALVSLTPSFNFFPEKEYYLEPRAPQPDFKSIYGYLKENLEEGDVLVDSYPEIASWYGFDPDYWLAFSISGLPVSDWVVDREYVYAHVPAVEDLDELKGIYFNNPRGWVVIDSLSRSRLPEGYVDFLDGNMEVVKDISTLGNFGRVTLYSWGRP